MAEKNNRNRVAALAGVSSATVSRVYNSPDRVSDAKKEAVLRAARSLGYSPDKSASALRRRGTGQISLVSFEKKGRPWYWGDFPGAKWFFTDVLTGILSVMDSSMYRLNIKTLKSAEEALSVKWEMECDGALFFDVDSQEEADAIARVSVPAVISHHSSHFENNHCCSTDNGEGGRLAAAHLVDSGYGRAAYISYLHDSNIPNRERYEGFCRGFDKTIPLYLTDPGKEGGYRICTELLEDIRSGRIDSLGVVNDMTAVGVIHCLLDNSLKPGRDLGLIAYDNMPFNYALPYSLSTVDLKPSHIYREAVTMLLDILNSPAPETGHRKKVVFPELIRGETV